MKKLCLIFVMLSLCLTAYSADNLVDMCKRTYEEKNETNFPFSKKATITSIDNKIEEIKKNIENAKNDENKKKEYEKLTRKAEGKNEYTPLSYAVEVENKNEEIINDLINSESIRQEISFGGTKITVEDFILGNKDISAHIRERVKNIGNETKLFECIEKKDPNSLEKLLTEKKFDINSPRSKKGKSAFETVVLNALESNGDSNTMELLKILLKNNIQINKEESSGKTMLTHIVDSALNNGLNSTKKEILKLLLENSADARMTVEDQLPLIPYIAQKIGMGSNFELLKFLFSPEIQENKKIKYISIDQQASSEPYNNYNALCIAIENDNADLLDYLISTGSKIDIKINKSANEKFTPLGLACMRGKSKCAESLLSKDASIYELQDIFDSKKVTVFMAACSSLPWNIVSRILEKSESDKEINKEDSNERNAFMYAAIYNKDKKTAQAVMRNLRGRKAEINKKTKTGDNAISLAIKEKQDISNIMWLLQNDVKFEKNVSSETLDIYKGTKEFEILKQLNNED